MGKGYDTGWAVAGVAPGVAGRLSCTVRHVPILAPRPGAWKLARRDPPGPTPDSLSHVRVLTPSSAIGPTAHLPPHLQSWTLPTGWRWGGHGAVGSYRHYQEVVDNLGRSLSLVTAPEAAHAEWLETEARLLAQRNHPSIPTTYLAWAQEAQRGPAYLRRWIVGQTLRQRVAEGGPDVSEAIRVLRLGASTLASLHDAGVTHGAVGPDAVWLTPSGRVWCIGWQWAVGPECVPEGLTPMADALPWAPEWGTPGTRTLPRDARTRRQGANPGGWAPTPQSDQWQLAASVYHLLTGVPWDPGATARAAAAGALAAVPGALRPILERALDPEPRQRYGSMLVLLRDLERTVGTPRLLVTGVAGRDAAAGAWARAGSADATEAETARTGGQEILEARLRRLTADDYEVMSPIGSGASGSVWRVRDLALGRHVALKVLHPDIAADTAVVSRFREEAGHAARLAHPGIVPVYDWETREGVAWYTMELADNGSLADLVSRSGVRAWDEIRRPVAVLLDALAGAHAAGVIHRDLKPENILVDRWGHWRIGDFGIARTEGHGARVGAAVNATPGPSADGIAGHTGTPGFAAPEQLLGESVEAPADLWSLAAVVYYVLTGEPPFGTGTPLSVLARQLGEAPARLGQLDPGVGTWLARMLHSEPAQRFATAQAAREAWLALPLDPAHDLARREGTLTELPDRQAIRAAMEASRAARRAAELLDGPVAEPALRGGPAGRAPDPRPAWRGRWEGWRTVAGRDGLAAPLEGTAGEPRVIEARAPETRAGGDSAGRGGRLVTGA